MAQRTPGPWVWRYKSGSLHPVGLPPYRYGTCVLEPTHEHDSGTDTKVSDADAALIEAAPDLLDALKYARRFLNSKDHDTDFVDAAIAKATATEDGS